MIGRLEYDLDRILQQDNLPIRELHDRQGRQEHGYRAPYHRHHIPRRPSEHFQNVGAEEPSAILDVSWLMNLLQVEFLAKVCAPDLQQ
jgi:hypothetical protein